MTVITRFAPSPTGRLHVGNIRAETANPATGGEVATQAQQLTPEMLEKIAEVRVKIQAGIGQVVLAMMNLPRYRHNTLADLTHVILDPLMRDRIAIAHVKNEGKDAPLAGIAIWASVSDVVDAKITEQIRAGVFPIRLANEDWVSGETLWLLDVLASSRKHATAVLTNFKQISGDRPVKIHPIVARSIEPGLLEKMKAAPVDGSDATDVTAEAIPEPAGTA